MARTRPGKQSLNIYISEETHKGLKFYSVDHGEPLGEVLSRAVEEWWKANAARAKYQALIETPPTPTPESKTPTKRSKNKT